MLDIQLPQGRISHIKISMFSALDGWEMQRKFLEFAASIDSDHRRAFTMEVLSYATVVTPEGQEIPLRTGALINNHLDNWKNVERVFNEVLLRNGIDPSTHAERPEYWEEVGARLSIAFFAEASKLLGPAFSDFLKGQAAKSE